MTPARLSQRQLVIGLLLLAFTVLMGYAICGAAAQSLFLQAYGSKSLPAVWLAVAAASAATVALVNWATQRLDVVDLFWRASVVSGAILVALMLLHGAAIPGMPFVIYIWKEIYVVVLVELFWTFANVYFGINSASSLYGWFLAAGSLGGVVGSVIMGPLAHIMGTFQTLWLTLPCIAVPAWVCRYLGGRLPAPARAAKPGTDMVAGWRLIRASGYLWRLLLLVGIVQVVNTVVDYQYNEIVELAFPDVDERTGVIGDVYAVITALSMGLQMLTSVVLRLGGVGSTLVSIPVVLATTLLAFVGMPGFATMTLVKICGKTLDYSLFRAAKEILYIPLSYAEKTRGKAVVDMFTYRFAKAGASLLVLALAGAAPRAMGGLNLLLVAFWLALTLAIVSQYRRLASNSR